MKKTPPVVLYDCTVAYRDMHDTLIMVIADNLMTTSYGVVWQASEDRRITVPWHRLLVLETYSKKRGMVMDPKKRDELFILFLLATVLGTLAGILLYLIGFGK